MPFNGGFDYEEQLGPDADAQSLLAYLTRRYRHSSPSEWRARIETHQVLIDSKPARPETVVRRGQAVLWRRPPWTEPDVPPSFAVLFDDDDLLAVDKPAGLPTLPGAGFLEGTLLYRVRQLVPDAAPLHRLGRWTSGVVLFARTRKARAELCRQWAAHEIGKRYRALASGAPSRAEFTVTEPIGPLPHPRLGHVHAATPTGKPASTHVTVLDRRPGGFLCDVRITTGRPHQIRIHLAASGHPLLGDPLYVEGGVPGPNVRALPGDRGYSLHAAELTLRHPRTLREIAIECPPPPRLRRSSTVGGE